MTRPGDGRGTRTILLGGALALLTLAGHTAAGGGLDLTGTAVAVAFSLALAGALSARSRSLPALVAILVAGQALLHLVLTLASGHSAHVAGGPGVSAPVMATAHLVAAVVAAALVRHADQVASAWRRFAGTLLGTLTPSPAGACLPPGRPVAVRLPASSSALLRHHVVRRGPPAAHAPA